MLIDTHCHLNSQKFSKNLAEVVTAAKKEGIEKIFIPGYSFESCKKAYDIAKNFSDCYLIVGIHPCDSLEWSLEIQKFFEELAGNFSKFIAIGEIGLDFYWNKPNKKIQIKAFEDQLKLADLLSLPVVIHSRNAEKECLEILKENKVKKAVFHCYSGSLDLAEKIWREGYFTSFTGNITYPKSEELRLIIKNSPLEKIMIETDAPYLAPQKFRGELCEPKHLIEIFKCISEIKGVEEGFLAKTLYENTKTFFNF